MSQGKFTLSDVTAPSKTARLDPFEGEEKSLDLEKKGLENEHLRAELKAFKDNTEQRKRYGFLIFGFVTVWMVLVLAVVILDGWIRGPVDIDIQVLLALITSTTVNVLGILMIVAKFFFPEK